MASEAPKAIVAKGGESAVSGKARLRRAEVDAETSMAWAPAILVGGQWRDSRERGYWIRRGRSV